MNNVVFLSAVYPHTESLNMPGRPSPRINMKRDPKNQLHSKMHTIFYIIHTEPLSNSCSEKVQINQQKNSRMSKLFIFTGLYEHVVYVSPSVTRNKALHFTHSQFLWFTNSRLYPKCQAEFQPFNTLQFVW